MRPKSKETQYCLARALYDNVAESPDELDFKKGDTLTVLDQNVSTLNGWWLCSYKGRQGICPANRLRLIPGVYDGCEPRLTSSNGNNPEVTCGEFHPMLFGKMVQWNMHSYQVAPRKSQDLYLYDMPPRLNPLPVMSPSSATNEDYDVPPRAVAVGDEAFKQCPRCSPTVSCNSPASRDMGDTYDVPRPHLQLTPSSSASSLTADSMSSSNRSSLANMGDYDVPRSHRVPTLTIINTLPKELPLELDSALETLQRLQTDTNSAINKLLNLVGPNWRSHDRLIRTHLEIKLAVTRLHTSLHDFSEFGEGALGNAKKASDKNLASKLSPLVSSLKKSNFIVHECVEKLEHLEWSVGVLVRDDEGTQTPKPDALDRLVHCARALTEDIRQVASFIQGNGLLLFRKDNNTNSRLSSNSNDYDYVKIGSSTEAVSIPPRRSKITNEIISPEIRKGFNQLVGSVDSGNHESLDNELSEADQTLLLFFSKQLVTHHKNLSEAIDQFLHVVECNQPPKVFLAHGKFVVLSAHYLVHIGDTVRRNATAAMLRERSRDSADALANALADTVAKSQQAALRFPSVPAVQAMLDAVISLANHAHLLKLCLLQALSTCPILANT